MWNFADVCLKAVLLVRTNTHCEFVRVSHRETQAEMEHKLWHIISSK